MKKAGWTWINDKQVVQGEGGTTGCFSKKDLENGLGLKAFWANDNNKPL